MQLYGITMDIGVQPPLDKGFMPMAKFITAFDKSAANGKQIAVCIEREAGKSCVYKCRIHGTAQMKDADRCYVERIIKFLLWQKGGYRITVYGDDDMAQYIAGIYCARGERDFDVNFMSDVYEREFSVESEPLCRLPDPNDASSPVGGDVSGCRIGFDAGGSDRKVSAVIDGEVVYSEEVVWHPKTQSDPRYHFDGIVSALRTAAEHMPRVDAIGISSAGVFVDNRCMKASLFIKVPPEQWKDKVADIFIRAAKEFKVPFAVCNDGDVAALAGRQGLGDTNVLGIAMGTSEAGGYVDEEGNIRGWLNELAFAPVDMNPAASADPWSGDVGVGAEYFSQDCVIRLAETAGIALKKEDTPANKLAAVQQRMEQNDDGARRIYQSIGVYLGHTMALYHMFYGCRHVLLMGRVMSGRGGDIILDTANRTLADEYPQIKELRAQLPDEKTRRVGQSVAAASLPKI